MNYPQYLYHYTNLSALCSILKSGAIRFKPLTELDDLDEKEIKDFRNLAKYVFVSSWTCEERESIPFWNMYTRHMEGVRIRLRSLPFEKYVWEYSDQSKAKSDMPIKYIPKEFAENDKYAILPLATNLFCFPVEYTDDEKKLYPSVLEQRDNGLTIFLDKVGKYKRTEWGFQKEWRYRLNYFASGVKELGENPQAAINKMLTGLMPEISHIDLKISKQCLEDVEIVMGPKMNNGDKEILYLLCEKYIPKAEIKNSRLRIR